MCKGSFVRNVKAELQNLCAHEIGFLIHRYTVHNNINYIIPAMSLAVTSLKEAIYIHILFEITLLLRLNL